MRDRRDTVTVRGNGSQDVIGRRDAYTSEQSVLGVFVSAKVVCHGSSAQHWCLPVEGVARYWSDAVVAHRTQKHVHLPDHTRTSPLTDSLLNQLLLIYLLINDRVSREGKVKQPVRCTVVVKITG